MDVFLVLQDAYKCLLAGERPGKESHELAWFLCSNISGDLNYVNTQMDESICDIDDSSNLKHSLGRKRPYGWCGRNEKETLCFVLSLMETVSTKLISGSQTENAQVYYNRVITVSLEEMALMTRLVSLFGDSDQLVSHFAAKCASSLVLFQLNEFNSFNQTWQERCVQILRSACPGSELSRVLWSITAVIKGVLTRMHHHRKAALEQLVSVMDPALSELQLRVLTWLETREQSEPMAAACGPPELETSLDAVVDFFEALFSTKLSLALCPFSPRLLPHQASVLLRLAGFAPVTYAVQKKALLLLKACLLQRAGEDFAPGGVAPLPGEDGHMTADMLTLSDAILQAVRSNWLGHVPVKKEATFFGGSCLSSSSGLDFVMLRAASLVLLKSLEYKFQHDGEEACEHPVRLNSYLAPLMLFVGQHLSSSRPLQHPCVWLSVVFGEQDDDMIEAARIILNLYLYSRRSDGVTTLDACDVGCGPHCHFILLLQSVAFDHSVLLDFLISTETCFLDYFVRYLKLLRDNWADFERACQGLEAVRPWAGSEVTGREKGPVLGCMTAARCVGVSETPLRDGSHRSCSSQSAPSMSSLMQTTVPPLVDYSSSDDSEAEGPSISCAPVRRTAGVDSSEESGWDMRTVCLPGHEWDLCPDELLAPERVCRRTLVCLGRLRRVIVRLQRRKLFPYKPDSLLKLLLDVQVDGTLEDDTQCS